MPSGQLEFSLRGETNEQFASVLLSELAFVTRVSRPMDVGHDLICVIKEPDERNPKYIRAGPSFTVQVKSNDKALQFKGEDEVQWLKDQEIPFFLCIVDRQNFSIALYSTWNMHNSYLYCDPKDLILVPNDLIDPITPTYPRVEPDCREKQTVPLGKPILRMEIVDTKDTRKLRNFSEVLKKWILLEQENIVNIRSRMHWVVGCVDYETNIYPDEGNIFVYYNFVNHQYYVRNLGRVVSLLRLALEHTFKGKEREFTDNPRIVDVLDELLLTYMEYFDPEIQNILRQKIHIESK